MKIWFASLVSIALLTSCSVFGPKTTLENAPTPRGKAAAVTHFEPGKGVVIAQGVQLAATVVSVDARDRSIVVKGVDGEAHKIELTEDVKNFDQIDPGDEVVVEMYSALAMQLAKHGEPVTDAAAIMVAVAQPGDKPMMVVVDVVEVLAKITAIDRETRSVTVTGPMGNAVMLQVPEDVKGFSDLKVGDEVNARYAETFAISVQVTN